MLWFNGLLVAVTFMACGGGLVFDEISFYLF